MWSDSQKNAYSMIESLRPNNLDLKSSLKIPKYCSIEQNENNVEITNIAKIGISVVGRKADPLF